MLALQRFLEKNGLFMAEFEKEDLASEESFNVGLKSSSKFASGRDEYGHLIVSSLLIK